MNTIYRKVLTADRLPDKEGHYFVNRYDKGVFVSFYCKQEYKELDRYWKESFEWWLEEIELPSDEDIEKCFLKIEPRGYGCSFYKGLVVGAKDMRDNKINVKK